MNLFFLRSKFLKLLDLLFSFPARIWRYTPFRPVQSIDHPEIVHFVNKSNYFSEIQPIIGRVSNLEKDFLVCKEFLEKMPELIPDPFHCEQASLELLTKAIAYRDLHKGMEFSFLEKGVLRTYVVDYVFSLWKQIPAFGLLPKDKGVPILLFRGTDWSFHSSRGRASILSDFDFRSPGFCIYQQSSSQIRAWLHNKKARAMGFSLGGTLSMYTALFEPLSMHAEEPSICFNPAGVFQNVKSLWEEQNIKPPLICYITTADIVSKVGHLLGEVKEFSFPTQRRPNFLKTHTDLMFLYAENSPF